MSSIRSRENHVGNDKKTVPNHNNLRQQIS